MIQKIRIKKRGISIMIGYILLITIAIIMSVIVYQWLRTYVPRGEVECPSETSFYIKEYTCTENELTLTIQNNGRFEIGGYYIKAANAPDQEIATIDISKQLIADHPTTEEQNVKAISVAERIFFNDGGAGNLLNIGEKTVNIFSLTENLYKLDLTPLRFQQVGNTNPAVACSKSRIEYEITCQ